MLTISNPQRTIKGNVVVAPFASVNESVRDGDKPPAHSNPVHLSVFRPVFRRPPQQDVLHFLIAVVHNPSSGITEHICVGLKRMNGYPPPLSPLHWGNSLLFTTWVAMFQFGFWPALGVFVMPQL